METKEKSEIELKHKDDAKKEAMRQSEEARTDDNNMNIVDE